MNFGANDSDSGSNNIMRSPAGGRRSQALSMRQQQSPYQPHQQQSLGSARTPNSRFNTPSKGLPKASYLQRRAPGTPLQSERTPGCSTPYTSNTPSSHMNMSISMTGASPSPGMSTPGRRGGRRGDYDARHFPHQSQDYSRMDETLTGGDEYSTDTGNQVSYKASQASDSEVMIRNGTNEVGMRQRRNHNGLAAGAESSGGRAVTDDTPVPTQHLHPHWVIVFGLPGHPPDDSPCATTNVLKLFQGHGNIDNYHTSPGNWLLIKFSSSVDASNSAGILHRTFLTSEVMIGVELLTPDLAKKLNLTFQVDGKLVVTPGKVKKYNRVEQQGKAQAVMLDPDYDNIMRPPRKVTKDICSRIFEFFMY